MNVKNRFSKPVAFNKTNADDQQIIEHVKEKNFSGYVKDLILADMRKKPIHFTPPIDPGVVTNKENGVTKVIIR